jgi:uncharacterized protein
MSGEKKLDQLLQTLGTLDSMVVALSGGVDSAVLLAAALHARGRLPASRLQSGAPTPHIRAVTVRTPYVPNREREDALAIASFLGVEHHILDLPFPEELKNNPELRCYFCKKKIFSRILEYAELECAEEEAWTVLEGSNADDLHDYRPGMRALDELGIRSPLAEAGLAKEEVREIARSWGLPVWNKPSYSCLLTRFPHGSAVNEETLLVVDRAETVLREEGFGFVRVNSHGSLARIEVLAEERRHLCETGRMDRIDAMLRKLGYRHVTFDLGGYRRGSMDR